jgi:two-component system sensor histidine kinase SenX3
MILADTVELEAAAIFGGIAALAVVLLIVLLLVWRTRRRLVRRLHGSIVRLDPDAVAVEQRGLEWTLSALDRAVDDELLRGGEATVAEVRFARGLAAMPSGVLLYDEEGTVAYRNDPAAGFIDARHGDALVEEAIDELRDAALTGEEGGRTLELFGPPRRTLVVSASPLDDGRRSIGALIVVDDVTERRRLDAVRRDFVANISHELKTPVGGLGLLAETIVSEDDPAVVDRLAQRMHDEAFRVSRIIDDLLELSRIEAGEARLGDPVSVGLVIAEAAERLRSSAERRGITLDIIEAPKRLAVIGDRRQLTSAIANLLDNAVKYSEDGSAVTVKADATGDQVEIEVTDHGVGIPRRDLERVFERFYRVDRARSRETGGTGLGLAIVRHVASNHSGDISVTSREGEGSTFVLSLPAVPGPVGLTSEAV